MNSSLTLKQLQAYPKDRMRDIFGLEPAALGELLAAVLPPCWRDASNSRRPKG